MVIMGQKIDLRVFSEADTQAFQQCLLDNLSALKQLLARPNFGQGASSIGAELEMYLVDKKGRPVMLNKEVLERSGHPQLALELNRYNVEFNHSPVSSSGTPFSQIEQEMLFALAHVTEQLEPEQASALPIGILPTLKRSDFGDHAMTDEARFIALTQALQQQREGMFCIKIEGDPPISLRAHDVTLEGANTSMQVHFRVNPDSFANTFNALQLMTPVVVGMAANSPFMLGHKLWHETRIPLFKQAIDGRSHEECNRELPSRVDFGTGWVREGAYELFAEMVRLYEPIFPICSDEDALEVVASGGVPELHELRLHSGTVWPWNRAVYDPQDGGHLRIEMRSLPAGPTPCDMVANAAFSLGAAKGLQSQMDEIIPAMPFSTLANNFYQAAKKGINAELMWPLLDQPGKLRKIPIKEIAKSLIPVARAGLDELGVDSAEADYYLGIMQKRIESGVNGAVWQRREYLRLCRRTNSSQALSRMVQNYMNFSAQNQPVSTWVNHD